MAARPDLVKPNRAEAEELLGMRIASEEELLRAGCELLALGAGMAVISLGKEGALGAAAGKFWRARPPAVEAASSIAAGDSMVAVLACAMINGLPFAEALRHAVAAGTATAAMTGSSVAGRGLIHEFLPRVVVKEVAKP
jgi:1-phosphofructokinase